MNTSTLVSQPVAHGQRAVSLAGWLAAQWRRAAEGLHVLLSTRPHELRNAAEVLALAESVEATQPSWAADLRAVAMHMEAAEQQDARR
jgi:hypothetical protein